MFSGHLTVRERKESMIENAFNIDVEKRGVFGETKMRILFLSALFAALFLLGCPGGRHERDTTPRSEEDPGVKEDSADDKADQAKDEEPMMAEIWKTVEQANETCDLNLKKAQEIRKRILAVEGKRTKENTLEPMNALLIKMDRILPMAELISNTHPEKAVRTAAEECEQKAKKYVSELKLDRDVYEALKGVEESELDSLAARFRSHLLRDYRRAGVDRDEATRKKLAEIQNEMVKLGQEFTRNIRDDKKSIRVSRKELAGMPEDFVNARAGGVKKGEKIEITTEYPDFFPVQAYADDDGLRRRLYTIYLQRAYPVNEDILRRILKLRHEYATALGYSDWAQYNAEDKMVENRKVIADFIDKVAELAEPRMKADLKDILKRKRKDNPRAKQVQTWDRFYYVNKIREERYGVNPEEVRSYFPFESVKKGLLSLSEELFGVEFKRVENAEVWHPRVETYDVYEGNERIARFYLDLHPREGKYGHAALFPIYSGIKNVQIPSSALVTNFPDPEKSEHALTEHNQVTVFFHEFGHLMHQLLSGRQRWVTQSGISCEWDFVEVPSQLYEEWSWDPEVLARFARHYKTGKPIPASLVENMRKADEFGKGIHVMRQMFFAALSLRYHDRDPGKMNMMKEMLSVGKQYSPYPHIKGTATYASFGHLSGYSSMYYTYMWSLVISKDLFTRFQEAGLMDAKTSAEYRKAIIEPGGAVDASDMVEDFLGRPYSFDAFRAWLQQN